MVELDEKYCDVIVQRFIRFKGNDSDVFLLREGQKVAHKDISSV
mgnify:CR=1 FL=1